MNSSFAKTESVCPVCLQTLEAEKIVGEDGFLYLQKTCPEHGTFSTLIWEDSLETYLAWGGSASRKITPTGAVPVRKGCPHDCGLCEAHERNGCCVLLELTDRCNLHCPVCFASAKDPATGKTAAKEPTLDELAAQYDLLMQRGGPFNIQLSGGEPTMRDDLPAILSLGREKGFSFFQLNTNGIRIAEEDGYAELLAESGVSCVFLQFDGLEDSVYRTLRGRALKEQKLRAVDRCREAGLSVVLVPVIAPGVNDFSLGDILRFALEHMPDIRGVHFQPVSYFGRCALTPSAMRLTIPRILNAIEEQTGGLMKRADFGGGGAESPYCSFHASYLRREDGTLKALPRRQTQSCCVKSSEARDFVARQWNRPVRRKKKACCCSTEDASGAYDLSSLDAFLERTTANTFTVSGMLFQDAWNLDLERLRRCYICEVDPAHGMVPFCAYNLTDINGKALYRS